MSETHKTTGLKVRRATGAATAKPKLKPKKMNLVRPKRKEIEKSALNSALLTFPTDRLGTTSKMKAGFLDAIGRMGKDPEAFKLIVQTAKVLINHAEKRFEHNQELPTLKKRSDKIAAAAAKVEVKEDEESEDEVSYGDMYAALKEAGVKPESRSKADVEAAYLELQKDQ